jgi:hypothetical protein
MSQNPDAQVAHSEPQDRPSVRSGGQNGKIRGIWFRGNVPTLTGVSEVCRMYSVARPKCGAGFGVGCCDACECQRSVTCVHYALRSVSRRRHCLLVFVPPPDPTMHFVRDTQQTHGSPNHVFQGKLKVRAGGSTFAITKGNYGKKVPMKVAAT